MLLATRQLTARYADASAKALAFPDLSLAAGQHTLLLGPSGCGKTTLINVLVGLHGALAGEVEFEGVPVQQVPRAARDALRGNRMGLVMQRLHLIGALSVRANLLLALKLAGISGREAEERVSSTLTQLNLAHKIDAFPHTLSQGEAQRVAIARAIVHRPSLIVADEPTSALDDANCDAALRLLLDQAKACNATLLVATHDARLRPHFEHVVQL